MMKRKGISKKIRFEVFKRDSFKCQYCGRSAPEFILVIDHIIPVSKVEDNDIINLITSCFDCNSGKGKIELSDDAVINKRKKQLDELQERREQMEMVYEWQLSLVHLEEEMSYNAMEYFQQFTPGINYNEVAQQYLSKIIRKYGFAEILECIRISTEQYIIKSYGLATIDSAKKALDYIENIASCRKKSKEKPYLQELYYIRGILRHNFYCVDWLAIQLLEKAYLNGNNIDKLKEIALDAPNWTAWRTSMENLLGEKSL